MKKKVLIVNAVPLNNGDAALVLYAYHYFVDKGFEVEIATNYFKKIKQIYPEYPWVKEINDFFIFRKLPVLKWILFPVLFTINKAYRKADIIVGAPGGYINSYYGISGIMLVFRLARLFKIKCGLLPQSIGPLNESDIKKFQLGGKAIDFIISRDSVSSTLLEQLGVDTSTFTQSPDLAFIQADPETTNLKTKRVGVSVRSWKYDQRNTDKYHKLIASLIQKVVELDYEVVFLSTCQGLPGYVDDSLIAEKIYKALPDHIKSKVKVDKRYLTLSELNRELKSFDFVIGTRLHMCILAMNNGIPAFNISYEVKGLACYRYLELEEYSIDYNEESDIALTSLSSFINNLKEINNTLLRKLPVQKKLLLNSLEQLINKLN